MGKSGYKLFVVDDEDFDKLHKDLPYITEDKLKASWGFANPETKEAYVRRTGVKELDDITIEHEMEELLAGTSLHEVDGIRFKVQNDTSNGGFNWNNFFAAVFSPTTDRSSPGAIIQDNSSVPSRNNVTNSGSPNSVSTASDYNLAKDIPAPTQNILGSYQPLSSEFRQSQEQQFGTPVTLGGSTSNVSRSGGTLTASPVTTTYNPSVANPFVMGGDAGNRVSIGSNPPPMVSNAPAPTTNSTPASASSPLTKAFEQFQASDAMGTNPTPANAPTAPAVNVQIPASTPAAGGKVEPTPSFMDTLGQGAKNFLGQPQNILGLASETASLMQKQPKFEMPPSVETIRTELLSGNSVTPQGTMAKMQLGDIMKSTPQDLYPVASDAYYQAALRRTRDSYAAAKQNLDATYNNAGVYGSGEHLAAVAKLNQQLTNAEADLYAQTEAKNFELARTAKYQAIQDSLGVDKSVMDDLVGLTSLDVNMAAQKYGADVADVKAIREALGTMGTELIKSGMQQGTTKQNVIGK